LPAPTLTTATRGCTACKNLGVDAYRLPWWATFRTAARRLLWVVEQPSLGLRLGIGSEENTELAKIDP